MHAHGKIRKNQLVFLTYHRKQFSKIGKRLKCKEAELCYHVNPFEYQRTDQADGML